MRLPGGTATSLDGRDFLLALQMSLTAYRGVLNLIQKPLEQKVKGQEA